MKQTNVAEKVEIIRILSIMSIQSNKIEIEKPNI